MKPTIFAPQSPSQLVSLIQHLATGSFDRKYGNKNPSDVINAFALVTHDLTAEQIHTGLMTLVEMKYCPDAVVFRGWCLGQKTIDFTDAIADSYIGKTGALANIKRWLDDSTTPITVAQKQAYDETYHMFDEVKYSGNASYAQTQADSSFKDAYEFIVNQLVKERVSCQMYVAPVAIDVQGPARQEHHQPASKEFAQSVLDKLLGKKINKMECLA